MLIRMNTAARIAWTCIVACLVIGGTIWFFDQRAAEQASQQTNEDTVVPAYSLDETALSTEAQALLTENADLDTSISITDLQTGKSYHYGDDANYTAASISKLITAILYLHETELKHHTLTESVGTSNARDQLEKMIVESDNTAWHALNDVLTHAALQVYGTSIGLDSYSATENTVSSNDIALLLSKLAKGKLLNNSNTDVLLSLMQRADMRRYLVAGVPSEETVYHKVGYLADRLHEAAIVKDGDRSFVLVVFSRSSGNYNFGRGAIFFSTIARTTSEVFFGSSATTQ